jgi:hypothetical protein
MPCILEIWDGERLVGVYCQKVGRCFEFLVPGTILRRMVWQFVSPLKCEVVRELDSGSVLSVTVERFWDPSHGGSLKGVVVVLQKESRLIFARLLDSSSLDTWYTMKIRVRPRVRSSTGRS